MSKQAQYNEDNLSKQKAQKHKKTIRKATQSETYTTGRRGALIVVLTASGSKQALRADTRKASGRAGANTSIDARAGTARVVQLFAANAGITCKLSQNNTMTFPECRQVRSG